VVQPPVPNPSVAVSPFTCRPMLHYPALCPSDAASSRSAQPDWITRPKYHSGEKNRTSGPTPHPANSSFACAG